MKSFNIYSKPKVDKLDAFQFSWQSNEDVQEAAIMQCLNSDDLNDPRLGAQIGSPCATCGLDYEKCCGHWGYYEFLFPLFHPLRITQARRDLKSLKLKLQVKQNILNIKKDNDQWQSLTVLDLEGDEDTLLEKYDFLVKKFPISPPCLRPSCRNVGGSSRKAISYNDLTHRIGSLIRLDASIRKCYELNNQNDAELRRLISRLQLALTLLFFAPPGQRESRELSNISDRLRGKEGRLRLTLLGKRIEFSGRSPISGDVFLDLDQCGIPLLMARKLTLPERVTDFNQEYCRQLLFKNQVKYIQRGERTINPKFGSHQLKTGDICHRYLRNDDYVMLNRQPSLWSSSIQAFRAKIFDEKCLMQPSSIRLNVETTPSFNADFDGDEMVCYIPQSIESRAELKHLLHVREHLILGGNGVVQDSALGIFVLTEDNLVLSRTLYYDCLQWIQVPYFDEHPYNPPYTSRRLISSLLPPWLTVKGCVENGVVTGMLNKKITKKSILPRLHEDSPEKALKFLSSLQRVAAEYFRRRGFSVGLSSLLPDKDVDLSANIPSNLSDWEKACFTQKLKNEKSLEAKKLFNRKNPFLRLTSECSGAKGSLLNLIQMKTSLGQQYINGALIKKYRKSSYGNRVLSSDLFGKPSDSIYSKGYIEGSFIRGLKARELFLHGIASRVNLLDTALKTANSGYASRKLWKCLEDASVVHNTEEGGDYSVRCDGKILCFNIKKDAIKSRTIEPGFPIGIILSQQIGQKIMQLTLNTFHSTGSANSVVEGIPRMEALINCWTKKLAEQTMLTKRCGTMDIHNTLLKHDYLELGRLIKSCTVMKRKRQVKIVFCKTTCIRLRVHPWHLEEAVNGSFLYPVFVASIQKYVMIVENKHDFNDYKALMSSLKSLPVRGDRKHINVYDNKDEVQVTGTTLQEEFEADVLDPCLLHTNNPLEAAKMLGIEAAQAVLKRQLQKTFNNGVEEQYLTILCEWMCFLGMVNSTTRVGMERFYTKENAIKLMSFERTLRSAATAADNRTVAKLNGLSEKIVVNNLVQHGSGSVEILNKPSACGHKDCYYGRCNYVIEKKRRLSIDDDDEEPWLMDTQDYVPMDMQMEMPMNPMGYGMSMMPTDNFVG